MTTRASSEPVGDDSRVRHWPDLLFWYPGLSHETLERMPAALRRVYEDALPRLKAEQLSMMVDASAFPKMKEEAQKHLVRRIEKDLKKGLPRERVPDAPPAPADATKQAVELGIGMTFVDSDGEPVEVENVGGRPHVNGVPVGGES